MSDLPTIEGLHAVAPDAETFYSGGRCGVDKSYATEINRRLVEDRRAHNHYFRNVEGLKYIDVYRVLKLFDVTDPCLQHAVKKLLVAGGRGAGKSMDKDIKEAIDSLQRFQEMQEEFKG